MSTKSPANTYATTNIHSFSVGETGATTYAGSGRINGTVLDQFALSEYDGNIRVASTTGQWGRWWMQDPEPMMNHVWIMPADNASGELEISGHLGGIAEEERIWSIRFVGDLCYMVTFRNMDPLWTIDLSDPTNPSIIGELEIPGVSTYIHPLSEDYLLTIGIGPANEDGTGLDWSNTQLSMFNITNLSDPNLLGSPLGLTPVVDGTDGWSWSSSEATYEHKAFQYWAPKEMLAVPLSTYRYTRMDDVSAEEKQEVCEELVEEEWYWISREDDESGSSSETHEDGDSGVTEEEDSEMNDSESESLREELIESCVENYNFGGTWHYEFVSKLLLINVVPGEEMTVYGEIDHSQFYECSITEYCWWSSSNVRRTIFMGDYVYAISTNGVTAHNLTTLNLTDSVELEYEQNQYQYYYEDSVIVEEDGAEVSEEPKEDAPDEPETDTGTEE